MNTKINIIFKWGLLLKIATMIVFYNNSSAYDTWVMCTHTDLITLVQINLSQSCELRVLLFEWINSLITFTYC